jgi:hypothetical protein
MESSSLSNYQVILIKGVWSSPRTAWRIDHAPVMFLSSIPEGKNKYDQA